MRFLCLDYIAQRELTLLLELASYFNFLIPTILFKLVCSVLMLVLCCPGYSVPLQEETSKHASIARSTSRSYHFPKDDARTFLKFFVVVFFVLGGAGVGLCRHKGMGVKN